MSGGAHKFLRTQPRCPRQRRFQSFLKIVFGLDSRRLPDLGDAFRPPPPELTKAAIARSIHEVLTFKRSHRRDKIVARSGA